MKEIKYLFILTLITRTYVYPKRDYSYVNRPNNIMENISHICLPTGARQYVTQCWFCIE